MQDLIAVRQHGLKKERAEKPEISVADYRKPQRTVRLDELDLLPKFTNKVDAKFLLWRCRRNFVDGQTAEQAQHGKPNQNRAHLPFTAFENLRQPAGSHRSGDDGQECSQFNNAVAP